MLYLKFQSHRARERAQRLVGTDALIGVFSFYRGATGGFYRVEDDALANKILTSDIKGVTKLRPPYDDLNKCWSNK